MKAVGKVAIKLYEYLGASKQAARTASKGTAKQLAQMLSGKSRGEKKEFLQALTRLADDTKEPGNASYTILHSLTKGKSGKEHQAALDTWEALVMPLTKQRAINNIRTELPKIVESSVKSWVDDAMAEVTRPENINRIVTESLKEARKQALHDAGTLLYRVAAYPVNLVRRAFIPKGKRNMLSELVHKPKEQFKDAYYSKLLEKKGLSGRAPLKAEVTNKSAGLTVESILGGKSVEGGFNGFNNTISFTKEFSSVPRSVQANLLTHELRHFEQSDQIIRTFGIERYIQALKANLAKQIAAKAQYKDASPEKIQQAVEEFLKNNNYTDDVIRSSFAQSIAAPRINPNSVKGQRAKKYLEARENYQGLTKDGILTKVTDEYLNNAMEVEAYALGKKAGRQVGIVEDLNLMHI